MKLLLIKLTEWIASWLPDPLKRSVYRFKPLASLLRSGLNKAVADGVIPITVAAGGLKGALMELDLHSEKDYWLGTYELELQHAIQHFVKPGMVAYDVGANIGYVSLLLARAVGDKGKVFSIEALPANVERLKKHAAMNPFAACCTVTQAAVTDVSGPVTFLVHHSTSMGKVIGSAGRTKERYENEITIDGVSLDDLVYRQKWPTPHVVKMDIEGGEVLAIQGMERLLKESPPVILVELHSHAAVEMVFDALFKTGFSIHLMEEHYPAITSAGELGRRAYVVAIPPSGQ